MRQRTIEETVDRNIQTCLLFYWRKHHRSIVNGWKSGEQRPPKCCDHDEGRYKNQHSSLQSLGSEEKLTELYVSMHIPPLHLCWKPYPLLRRLVYPMSHPSRNTSRPIHAYEYVKTWSINTATRSAQAGVGSSSEELVPVARGGIWGPAALLFRTVYRSNGIT